MSHCLSVVLAQCNFMLGDITSNTDKIIQTAKQHAQKGADLVVFSELALIGYPPEDLLLRASLKPRIEQALERILAVSHEVALIVGIPHFSAGKLYNGAAFFAAGKCLGVYAKQALPNYQVFDEKRYFSAGDTPLVIPFKGQHIGLLVCEDIWQNQPIEQAVQQGADSLICINASPFCQHRHKQRVTQVSQHSKQYALPILYVNQVGAQDELIFDGGSFATDATGEQVMQMAFFQEDAKLLRLQAGKLRCSEPLATVLSPIAMLYAALVLALKDYVNKNGFKQVLLGLSGGIDSALTLALAVDALGKERVRAIMLPFTYTSNMSQQDAQAQATLLGVDYQSISIEPMYQAFMHSLSEEFAHTQTDTTEENLQARIRGVLLMAVSNKTGAMVVPTGNKSEMAVGYATLYGDMVGGYALLKDVYKTQVYALANYRNSLGDAIIQRVIERPPSAELAPEQKDEDSLPPYERLDAILEAYLEQDLSADAIVSQGFNRQEVYQVLRLVDINEYKRRQAAVGARVSVRGFGKDRRYPITNGWQLGV